ncbi:MAG: citrate/2-methylcitrate synthase [Alkalispirochaeta sp.]
MSVQQQEYPKGLEGVIAAESRICKVNGEEGKLYYLGYPIDTLVANSDFEEVTYLLLNGELPTKDQLADFSRRMREGRHLKQPILDMIRNFPSESHPMELLQSVVSYLSGYVEHKIHHGPHCNCRDTLHQVAQIASVIAALHRFRSGLDYVPPRDDLNHGANFLYMLHGEEPDPREGEIMDACLVLHAEHSFNASTFTARVVASTQSTCYSSISAAMGALYGSLHGGANEKVIAMVDQIKSPDRAEQYVKDKLARKEKVMGMGHRVYRAKDPRSIVMERFLEELSEKKGDDSYLKILKTVEQTFRNIMEEKGKPIYPNVDFFSGAVYRMLGIPSVLFTPLFAAARASGWLAHILEQREHEQRLFRPRALYVGEIDKELQPVEMRTGARG